MQHYIDLILEFLFLLYLNYLNHYNDLDNYYNDGNIEYKPTKDILNIGDDEKYNKWYWVSIDNGNFNFPANIRYGFIKYLKLSDNTIFTVLLSGEINPIYTIIFINGKWQSWIN